MPGRRDYSIVWARAITDARVLRAAELYQEHRLARAETAHAAVLGHLAVMGLWCSRETDDGSLPGDGIAAIRAATMSSPTVAKKILEILSAPDVDLLTREPLGGGEPGPSLRLRGVQEAYYPLLAKREGNRARAAKWREGKKVTRDVTRTDSVMSRPQCGTTGPDRTGEERNPPSPLHDGGSASSHPNGNGTAHPPPTATRLLTPADRAVLETLDRLAGEKWGFQGREFERLRGAKKALAAGTADPDATIALIDEFTALWPDRVLDVRRSFAMASNQRKENAP